MKTIEEKDAYFHGGMNAVKSLKQAIVTLLEYKTSVTREELLMVLDEFQEDIASLKAAAVIAEMKRTEHDLHQS